MSTETLSPQALAVINNYLHLPFPGRDISCPYYNNERAKVRAALRVLIGKGSVEDILEEAQIIALRDKIELKLLQNDDLKRFLVEQNIGIDCSALAYYILDAELRARHLGELKKRLKFPLATSPWRKLLTKLRPVENVGVATLEHEANSHTVPLGDIRPGDLIILLRTGLEHKLNHILIVHAVELDGTTPKIIHYTHSFKWRTEGKYHHGVRQGTIEVLDPTKPLVEQRWRELGKEGEENDTLAHAKLAEGVGVKRLRVLG